MPDPSRSFTAEEVDAAVDALSQPGRLDHAQEVVTHAAPALQRVLNQALDAGGYIGATMAAVEQAIALEDPQERALHVRTLLAEEARLGMFVGTTVGFELARELLGSEPGEPAA